MVGWCGGLIHSSRVRVSHLFTLFFQKKDDRPISGYSLISHLQHNAGANRNVLDQLNDVNTPSLKRLNNKNVPTLNQLNPFLTTGAVTRSSLHGNYVHQVWFQAWKQLLKIKCSFYRASESR